MGVEWSRPEALEGFSVVNQALHNFLSTFTMPSVTDGYKSLLSDMLSEWDIKYFIKKFSPKVVASEASRSEVASKKSKHPSKHHHRVGRHKKKRTVEVPVKEEVAVVTKQKVEHFVSQDKNLLENGVFAVVFVVFLLLLKFMFDVYVVV